MPIDPVPIDINKTNLLQALLPEAFWNTWTSLTEIQQAAYLINLILTLTERVDELEDELQELQEE